MELETGSSISPIPTHFNKVELTESGSSYSIMTRSRSRPRVNIKSLQVKTPSRSLSEHKYATAHPHLSKYDHVKAPPFKISTRSKSERKSPTTQCNLLDSVHVNTPLKTPISKGRINREKEYPSLYPHLSEYGHIKQPCKIPIRSKRERKSGITHPILLGSDHVNPPLKTHCRGNQLVKNTNRSEGEKELLVSFPKTLISNHIDPRLRLPNRSSSEWTASHPHINLDQTKPPFKIPTQSKSKSDASHPPHSSSSRNIESLWLCCFCENRCHHRGLGDLFGPYWIDSVDYWVHVDCLVWVPCVMLGGPGGITGLEEAVIQCQNLICDSCRKPGASVGCISHQCSAVSHFLCGKDSGWLMDENMFTAKCLNHK